MNKLLICGFGYTASILARKFEVDVAYRRSDLWRNIKEKNIDIKVNSKI